MFYQPKVKPLDAEQLKKVQAEAARAAKPMFTCTNCQKKTNYAHGGRIVYCKDCWYERNPNYDDEWLAANWDAIMQK